MRGMNAFWTFNDLLVWIGLGVPSLLASAAVARMFLHKTPSLQLVAAQFLFYLIWFLLLKAMFHLQYAKPFWSSLGFVAPTGGVMLCVISGPLLAILISQLALLTKAPPVDPPFKDLLLSKQYRVVFALAGVLIGPLCEELIFRGFLMPTLSKTMGVAAGIVVTGLAFSLLHGPQNHWIWQWILALTIVGSVFGWARWRFASTFSSTILHASFNCTAFVAQVLTYG